MVGIPFGGDSGSGHRVPHVHHGGEAEGGGHHVSHVHHGEEGGGGYHHG